LASQNTRFHSRLGWSGRFLLILLLVALCRGTPAPAQETTNAQAQIAAAQSEMNAAIQQVQKIVNQPVAGFARTAGNRAANFTPGWFHEGATKPDFNTVDVRATQERIYDKYDYVTSDLNPRAMTKYFYLDRSLPKKKLSEAEMVEINRLYRIIGRCEQQLAQLQNPEPATTPPSENPASASNPEKAPRLLNPYTGGGLLVLAGLVLVYSYKRRAR
jgi:hypothetical protein